MKACEMELFRFLDETRIERMKECVGFRSKSKNR